VNLRGLEVAWRGGLWVRWGADALLVDAGPATAAIGPELAALRALILTSGQMSAVGGVPALLEAVAAHRTAELPVHHVLGEERASLLVEAWQRGWPAPYDVSLDARPPGERFEVGPFQVATRRVVRGEPVVALRLTGPATIAWVPLCDPDTPIAGWCRGADLAVVQVSTRRGSLGPAEVIAAVEDVGLLWLIDEAGLLLDPPGA
jgi:hypothetical protein